VGGSVGKNRLVDEAVGGVDDPAARWLPTQPRGRHTKKYRIFTNICGKRLLKKCRKSDIIIEATVYFGALYRVEGFLKITIGQMIALLHKNTPENGA
jgi:hypothetical protein